MENSRVTLSIKPDREYLYNNISHIRVYNNSTGQVEQDRQVEYNDASELYLGTLGELKDSSLIVDTFARPPEDYFYNNKLARVNYEIKYGRQIVESKTVESQFTDKTFAFLGFRFRFCPRHPFC